MSVYEINDENEENIILSEVKEIKKIEEKLDVVNFVLEEDNMNYGFIANGIFSKGLDNIINDYLYSKD